MEAIYASEVVPADEVIALKYVAVSVVKAADGAGVYSYVFHLRTASGAVFSLGARYSVFRRLSSLMLAEQPEACAALPAFPPKHSMRRQTPEFLLTRGKALEAYLGAALGSPRLSALPAVRELLRAAELHKPAPGAADAGASSLTPPKFEEAAPIQAAGADMRAWQRPSVKMRSVAARTNAAAGADNSFTSTSAAIEAAAAPAGGADHLTAVDFALHPLVSILLAACLGTYFRQLLLSVGCCVVGLGAGRLCRMLGGDDAQPAALHAASNGTNGNGGANGSNGVANGRNGHGSNGADAATEAAAGLHRRRGADGAANSGGGASTDGFNTHERAALSEAVAAMRVLAEAVHRHDEAASGWKKVDRKEEVDVYLNARPDGSTWCMGIGEIGDAVDATVTSMESQEFALVLDKQLISATVLKELPTSAVTIDGWTVTVLQLMQSLYESPAWPVVPRETCTIKMKARRTSDGARATVQRSIDLPWVAVPKGFVRATVGCGGYECAPVGSGRSHFAYINVINPNGSIPQFVVNKTVPERALTVARLRQCVEARK